MNSEKVCTLAEKPDVCIGEEIFYLLHPYSPVHSLYSSHPAINKLRKFLFLRSERQKREICDLAGFRNHPTRISPLNKEGNEGIWEGNES